MERLCKYAVLRYVPDDIREEFINIGLVFHSPEDSYVNLQLTSNFSRVSQFDDETDVKFLKMVLEGVKHDFTQSFTDGPSLQQAKDPKLLEKSTSIYVNQLQFSPIRLIRSRDFLKDEADLFRTYVYFDSHKSKRITDIEVKNIMSRVFRNHEKNIMGNLERNVGVDIGPENIKLDFAFKQDKKAKFIKTLSFDYALRNSKKATQLAKEWAWNYEKMQKDKYSINSELILEEEFEIVTLIYFKTENKNIKAALDILSEVSCIVPATTEDKIAAFADEIVGDISKPVINNI
ncbi:hypothetical protein BGP34_19960 [Bacillus mycoides]|uniref:DUF3037 domain-containing protein n=1 Tax=Bacillus mycoides TaxID=1405 RepID=UPI000991A4BF|nr:DUF3037 domain-containing protein [Bacillus mycoides]OOR56045.1 hypothetical protein BGP34_19960 [Bacillus mycoides]